MENQKIYDIIGIGIGPFNLGLAALAANIPELDCLFIEKSNEFNWHPGMMLPTAKMQVPFYADLVTLANPTSPFTYINYLKQTGKLFRFAINETYFPYRSEFNEYCKWVVGQLNNLQFGHECKSIKYNSKEKVYHVSVLEIATKELRVLATKKLIAGIGSAPIFPAAVKKIKHSNVFHASDYLVFRDIALMHRNITLIGSGQSAAEIFKDLLPHINNLESLSWYTRSQRLYAMDYSKFALELSSPEYIHYFYKLPKHRKREVLTGQHDLYKGINLELITSIYEELYLISLQPSNKLPVIRTNCELMHVSKRSGRNFLCAFKQKETEDRFSTQTEVIILATGYQQAIPSFIDDIKDQINWTTENNYDVRDDYSIDNKKSIFVQNAEWHTHGFNSADLGLGPHRNAVILNSILKKEHFKIDKIKNVFQTFES